jgi:hypothetical protein
VTGIDTNALVTGGGGGGGGSGPPTNGVGVGTQIGVSAPARELLALQSVKSLRVMIRDGLMRKREKHGIQIGDDDGSVSLSAGSFRGTSLEDLNEIGYLHLTDDEKNVLSRDYSSYEYAITYHPVSHELGGMSTQMKVELPYPTVSMRDVEKDDRTGDLIEIKISDEALPKNKAETKIHELTRYASTASEANDDDDLHRSWSTSNAAAAGATAAAAGTLAGRGGSGGGSQRSGGAGGATSSTKKKKKSRKDTLDHAKSLPEGNKIWKDAVAAARKESVQSPNGSRRDGTS